MSDARQEITEIRKAIKKTVTTISVRNGRGTAWGWVEISGSGECGMFTETERAGLTALGLSPGGNFCVLSPDSRGFWVRKLTGQVPQGPPCIVCGQPGTEQFFCPCDLRHWLCAEHSSSIDRKDCAFIQREARS